MQILPIELCDREIDPENQIAVLGISIFPQLIVTKMGAAFGKVHLSKNEPIIDVANCPC